MTKHLSRFTSLAAVTVAAFVLAGCCSLAKFSKALIIHHPQSLTVTTGQNATFSVLAVKGGPNWTTNGLTYQWQVNTKVLDGNNHWVNLAKATNPSVTIMNVQLANVGYYRCLVEGAVPSGPASLQMVGTGGSTITVYGTPRAKTGNSGTSCPGSYKYVIDYTNTPPAIGWTVVDRKVNASAQNGGARTDARMEYLGVEGGDTGCAAGTVTIPATASQPLPPGSVTPPATKSARYEFTIYFKNNPAPPSPYALILSNFQ